jgi:hypothetical protein
MVIVLVPMQAPFIAYQRNQVPHRADFPKDNHTDRRFATTCFEISGQTACEMAVIVLSQTLGQTLGCLDRLANDTKQGDTVPRL